MHDGAGGIAHADEEVGESRMELEDILSKSPEALIERHPCIRIVFTNLGGSNCGGSEQFERLRAAVV